MKNTGFTLIELLVVVLIVGILAAAALPQYEKAVERSRIIGLLPNLRHLKDALESYYMANGVYPGDGELDLVGVEISGCRLSSGNGILNCGEYSLDYNGYPPHADPNVYACTGTTFCQAGTKTKLIWYLDRSASAGTKKCTSEVKGLCASLEGYWQ